MNVCIFATNIQMFWVFFLQLIYFRSVKHNSYTWTHQCKRETHLAYFISDSLMEMLVGTGLTQLALPLFSTLLNPHVS